MPPIVSRQPWYLDDIYWYLANLLVPCFKFLDFLEFKNTPRCLDDIYLYLAIFGSVIAFGCYLTLLNNIGAHKASYATIMFPAIAVIISTLVEDFSWSSHTIIGLICIFSGNIVVSTKPKFLRLFSKTKQSDFNAEKVKI